MAIKTLYYAALEPQGDIQDQFHRARRDLVTDLLLDLNDQNLLILTAATQAPEPLVKSIYERYRRLAQQAHEEPYSYVYFYANLSYLQSLGLILLLSTKVGRTYANRVQLLTDPSLLHSAWQVRFG